MDELFQNLTNLIKQHTTVVLMTHKNPDLDGLGSAMGLYYIVKHLEKPCYIVGNGPMDAEEKNRSILKTLQKLQDENIVIPFLNETDYEQKAGYYPLLIILDTHKTSMVESEEILLASQNIVVIDHHIKHPDYIKNTVLNYINSNISSTVEIISAYLNAEQVIIPPLLATIMLAGLEIDTNGFNLKTTDKTYEAGAFLTKLGADQIVKQEILKENKEDYIKRHRFIENSSMITDNMAMCMMDDNIYNVKDLATISEELLQLEGIEASFTIGKLEEDIVGVSARSIGNIDVEAIMVILGGGGHMTEAATQIKQKSMQEVKKLIMKAIGE